MTTDPNHLMPLPEGLTEDDVLAWIECELPAARHEDVGRAIDADAVVAGRARRMRADREAVRALPEMQAPIGLMDSVEATLERQALLGIADGVELINAPPIFIVSSARRPLAEVFSLRSAPMKVAAAAGLLLAIAAGAYMGIWMLNQPGGPTGPVALNDPASDAERIGTTEPGGEPTLATTENRDPAQPPAGRGLQLAWMQSPIPSDDAESDRIGTAEALELAAAGRLVVHVSSRNVNQALRDLGELVTRPHGAMDEWRLSGDVPERVAAALSPGEPSLRPFALAGGEGSSLPELNIDRPTRTGVYLADARLTPESLEALLAGLGSNGRTAEFIRLDEPIDLGQRPLRLDEILWWSSSPTDWAMWTRVPVVFEPER